MARRSSQAVIGQKRRRMSMERSYELEKRYPERIKTMSRDSGLEYSQVNGWFVNKRAIVRTELAKKELETEKNLLRAKNQQLEAIVRDLMASNEHLKSQLIAMEISQRDVKNKEILESSQPVGFTGAGTSSGIVLAAAPAETLAAPAYHHRHLLQGAVNEPAAANMFNNYGYGPVAAPAYPHLQGTGNEPAAANMLNNYGFVPVAAAPAYPRRHLLQGTGNEPAEANMFNNKGYGTVAAAPGLDIDAYDEVAMINNSYDCGYCDVQEYSPLVKLAQA